MGFQLDAAASTTLAPAVREKLTANLKQAAGDYRAGRFDQAVAGYQAALQLDAGRQDVQQALALARQMQGEQAEILKGLSQVPADRERFFSQAYQKAAEDLKAGRTQQALNRVADLWRMAGDYRGKTVSLLEQTTALAKVPAVAASSDEKPVATGVASAQALPPIEPAQALPPVEPAQAPPPVGPALDAVSRMNVSLLLNDVQAKLAAGDTVAAKAKLAEATAIWPDNPKARQLKAVLDKQLAGKATQAAAVETTSGGEVPLTAAPATYNPEPYKAVSGAAGVTTELTSEQLQTVNAMILQASRSFQNGDLEGAHGLWAQALQMDPSNKVAQTWLKNTAQDYEKLVKERKAQVDSEKRKDAARQLLGSPIGVSTDREIPLSEFMSMVSAAAPSELQYSITEGAQTKVFANFKDQPLRDVLTTVLEPRGLSWSIDNNNVITISQKLKTKTYRLTTGQLGQVRALLDAKRLQNLLWGQEEAPAPGLSIELDERQSLLMVTGSDLHLQRIESLLPTLGSASAADLVTHFYKIREEDGDRIRALINSVVHSSKEDVAFESERRIIVDGEDLIVRDTPDNIKQIEDLLMDKGFIQNLRNEKIDIQVFSLAPKNIETIKTDELQVFTSRVVEAIKVFLYAQEGESKAAEEGRRMWFDEASNTLTVVDTPSNLERVGSYIDSLPEIGAKNQTKVIKLKNAVASDLAGSLMTMMELQGAPTGPGGETGSGGGNEWTVQLSRGQEKQVGSLRIRLMRVQQNDVNDRYSASAELSINTGTEINQVTIQDLETQFVQDYEITANNVLAAGGSSSSNSGSQTNNGTANITIRYVPRALAQFQQQQAQTAITQQLQSQMAGTGAPAMGAGVGAPAAPGGQAAGSVASQGITITAFEPLNALVIRYTDSKKYQEALDLIQQLDQPAREVAMEVKFVTVNESKAKEVGADFSASALGNGKVDWDSQIFSANFAQDADQYESAYDTLSSPIGPNFIKGTSVISASIGDNISYELRLLEAEGVLNVINGPNITSIDNQQATFRIENYASTATSTVSGGFLNASSYNPISAITSSQIANMDNATQTGGGLSGAVVLSVTPQITSENTILLSNLDAELLDFDHYLNDLVYATVTAITGITDQSIMNPIVGTQSMAPVSKIPIMQRKRIQTNARVSNGGTIVLGGWTGERNEKYETGVPVLRNLPYIGRILFNRMKMEQTRTNLLIFLTCNLIK
jgi:type II secretory pathway component GspD/PulD (secretin)